MLFRSDATMASMEKLLRRMEEENEREKPKDTSDKVNEEVANLNRQVEAFIQEHTTLNKKLNEKRDECDKYRTENEELKRRTVNSEGARISARLPSDADALSSQQYNAHERLQRSSNPQRSLSPDRSNLTNTTKSWSMVSSLANSPEPDSFINAPTSFDDNHGNNSSSSSSSSNQIGRAHV